MEFFKDNKQKLTVEIHINYMHKTFSLSSWSSTLYTCISSSFFFLLLPTFNPLELLVVQKGGKAAHSAFISPQPGVVGISPECISMSFKLSGHLLNKFIWRELVHTQTHACSHTVVGV